MAHQKLPFHADTVGSYLRSDAWKKAHADYKAGNISLEQRDEIVEAEVKKLVQASIKCGHSSCYRRRISPLLVAY